jgi:hypothetical protein
MLFINTIPFDTTNFLMKCFKNRLGRGLPISSDLPGLCQVQKLRPVSVTDRQTQAGVFCSKKLAIRARVQGGLYSC